MPDNSQKIWAAQVLQAFALRKSRVQQNSVGKSLPCKVEEVAANTVTVSIQADGPWGFQHMTVPIARSRYERSPVQVGDLGMVMSADTYMGGISGIGGGRANMQYDYGNLTKLIFVPVSNVSFDAPPDPNSYLVQGPNGVTIQTMDGSCRMQLGSGGVTITVGGNTITINASGITVASGDVTASSVSLVHHLTSGVQSGGGESGPPVPS